MTAKTVVDLVGMGYRGTIDLIAKLPEGHQLILKREPDNKYDKYAVQVWADDMHVGYLRSSQVAPIARAMDKRDAGVQRGPLFGKLYHQGRFAVVEIGDIMVGDGGAA